MNTIIIGALTATALPVQADAYEGTATTYITFGYYTRPTAFYDDAPEHEIVSADIHLFAPLGTDTLTLRGQIKAGLFAAGFTWPEETNASDSVSQHIVFEADYLYETGV
jgi:hypothetical protein